MTGKISPKPKIKICGLTRYEDARLALDLGADYLGYIFAKNTPREMKTAETGSIIQRLREEFGIEKVRSFGVFLNESTQEMRSIAEELSLFGIQVHRPFSEFFFDPELEGFGPHHQVLPALGVDGSLDTSSLENVISNLKKFPTNPESPHILFDTAVKGQSGGTGKVFQHSLVFPFLKRANIMVAGGLNAENIQGVLSGFQQSGFGLPYAFDLSSGLEEKPGIKSEDKVRQFFEAYHQFFESPEN